MTKVYAIAILLLRFSPSFIVIHTPVSFNRNCDTTMETSEYGVACIAIIIIITMITTILSSFLPSPLDLSKKIPSSFSSKSRERIRTECSKSRGSKWHHFDVAATDNSVISHRHCWRVYTWIRKSILCAWLKRGRDSRFPIYHLYFLYRSSKNWNTPREVCVIIFFASIFVEIVSSCFWSAWNQVN